MTGTTRKYGRRAPKRARAIPFSRIFSGVVPEHPASADYAAALNGGWKMLGNDVAGVCGPVTWANFRRLVTAIAGEEKYPDQEAVWELYRTQNPDFDPTGTADTNGPGSSADGGVDLQTLLEYLVKHGGPDGVKALAFARVDPSAPDEVKAAIAIFGGVWTGITVQEANQEDFAESKPWDYHRSSPDEGGHSVLTVGYAPQGSTTGALGGDERFLTWAEETSFTDRYFGHKVDELYVVIWPENLEHPNFLIGIDRAALAAAYQEITNRPFPVAPQPTPVPTPPPTPTPAPDPRLVEAAALTQQLANLMQPWAPNSKVN
ncbi:hypothetical protein ACFXKC_40910 [Streptomyces sp. NPDC059340]|uniref:hypothetical protein n=1 Tax=Streptomyces sp. NPDC059340 TaxID=3346806 RepID=UPI0036863507